MPRINIYRDSAHTWYFALWIDGEFDCTHEIDDAKDEDDAIAWCAERWPGAQIQVISPVE